MSDKVLPCHYEPALGWGLGAPGCRSASVRGCHWYGASAAAAYGPGERRTGTVELKLNFKLGSLAPRHGASS